MALNIPQYQPSGDMMSTINDYWSNREGGSDHNQEWAGANPGEYWTRKYGEALSWKRGQLEMAARKQAEELRIKMGEQKRKYQETLQKKKDAYQQQFEQYKTQFLSQYNSANEQNASFKNSLQTQAANDKTQLSGLLSDLLGKYDESYSTFQGKLGDFKDYTNYLSELGQGEVEDYGLATQGLLSQANAPQMYAPSLYTPDISTMSAAAGQVSPLMEQAQKRYEETYGWNPERLKAETEPFQTNFGKQRENLSTSLNYLGDSLTEEAKGLYAPGLYNQSDYNAALSTEQNLSQRLRQSEQGVLSQLNDMFSYASTFANQADNAYNTEKSNRLNERSAIQSQQLNDKLGNRLGQAEKDAAQQVTNRRQNTMLSFNPENSNLLSYLTRGY